MAALTEAQRRKQQMDDLLAAGAAHGHSLMVLQMDDLAGLLQRLQGGVANGTQALSNSLHAQTTTIEAMAKQVRELLTENTRLNARVAELEQQNLGIRQFDAHVQLQAKKLEHEAKTTDEMLGLIKIGAAAMLSRRGGGLGALGRLLGGGEPDSDEDLRGITEAPPSAPRRSPSAPMPSARAATVAAAEVAGTASASAEAAPPEVHDTGDGASNSAGSTCEEGTCVDEVPEARLLEGDGVDGEPAATAPQPESLGACAEFVLQRLSPSTLERVLACTEKPNRELGGVAPLVAVVKVTLGCCDEETMRRIHQEAGPELKVLVDKQHKASGQSLGACAKRVLQRLSPSTLERVLACTEKPNRELEGGAPIVTLVRLVLGCCDDKTLGLFQEEVGPGLQEHMTSLMLRSMS